MVLFSLLYVALLTDAVAHCPALQTPGPGKPQHCFSIFPSLDPHLITRIRYVQPIKTKGRFYKDILVRPNATDQA